MKINRILLCLMLALTACSQALPAVTPTPAVPTTTPTSALPTPIVLTTSQPDVVAAVNTFWVPGKSLIMRHVFPDLKGSAGRDISG